MARHSIGPQGTCNRMDFLHLWWLFVFLFAGTCSMTKFIPMRVVRESNQNSLNKFGSNSNIHMSSNSLLPEVNPAKFSGPNHLSHLQNFCFESVVQSYNYKLCPFKNITQYEDSSHFYPFQGILGVWEGWIIANGTFKTMSFNHGDACGSHIKRSTKVHILCGSTDKILNVTEPTRCKYEMNFQTPSACFNNSMFVYPWLSHELQVQWDQIYSEFKSGIVTEKGYDADLKKIFISAGFVQPKTELDVSSKESSPLKDEMHKTFQNLQQCQNDYNALLEKYKNLTEQLRPNSLNI